MKRRVALLLAIVLGVCTIFGTLAGKTSFATSGQEETSGEAPVSGEGQGSGGESTSAESVPGDSAGSTAASDRESTGADQSSADILSGNTSGADAEDPAASDGNTPGEDGADATGSGVESTPAESADNYTSVGPAAGIGQVEVSIGAALILKREVVFTVTLTDANGNVKENTITLGGERTDSRINFTGLSEGVYGLKVSGAGFADYRQDITVAKTACRIQLTTGFLAGYPYVAGGLQPGVLLIGDVDGDGDVDAADKDALVDAIDTGVIPAGYTADLNGDGAADLADLEYLAKSYGEIGDTKAFLETFVSPAVIRASVSNDTNVTGSLERLLMREENVVLTPASGEAISAEHPVSLTLDFSGADRESTLVNGIILETGNNNPITQAVLALTYEENGNEYTVEAPLTEAVNYLLRESDVYAEWDANGNIQVHLGSQVAVKRVTLTISAMKNNQNLAEISRVEFVGDMEQRIPEPEMNIPENLVAEAGSERFDLSWDPQVNVTGYEVRIQQGDREDTVMTVAPFLSVTSFLDDDVKNYTTYTVRVQSVNGTWRSGYGDPVEVTPKPSGPPDKPDNVTAAGRYRSIAVSWKEMDDTLTYNVFYKVRGSEENYIKIEGVETNGYTIMELEDLTEYEIYVTGVNELGESPESIHCAAKTTDLNPAEMIKYNLINRDENGVPGRAHLISASRNGGSMVDSAQDTDSDTAWGTVDNDAASYYSKTTWDDGGFNNLGRNGLFYEFDQAYTLDTIALLPTDGMQYSYAKVQWWDESGNASTVQASVQKKQDSEGRSYYMLKLPSAVTAKKIQIGLARYLATSAYHLITVSEVYFYHYDTLRDEIMALYTDDLHTVLREDVTQQTIDELRARVEAPDEFGEENPNKEHLLIELETAEKILNDEALNASMEVHIGISTNDVNRGFGGLNAWQPLGVTAEAGETITVYVGHNTKSTGQGTNLQLIATQYHSETQAVSQVVATLKVGANEITVPKLGTSIGSEAGGALYVQYTGNNENDRYAVRISGGTEVPVLDLYQVSGEARQAKAEAYVEALDSYMAQMESLHNDKHQGSENSYVDYAYDNKNCILGASDILLNTMMFSLPAEQVKAGLGSGSVKERAQKLLASMDAMEGMMYLFYQHKGLNAGAEAALNQIPKGHLNIRYQRMFSGAFMYASGNHIGIEWNECAGMVTASPVTSDAEGRYEAGRYFGWGIAHEIGHCINQKQYAVAEITNNYFSVLAQAKDNNESVRFNYTNVYGKVASGMKGNASNVFTQLAMYWQLHLAYDSGYNYKTYEAYSDQLVNLFFARVDTYARNVSAAPAPGGVALTLAGNSDQNLMRLSCAAAERNLLGFFERWGKTPDEVTRAYAEQFAEEKRAVYYANDDSRVYAKNGSGSSLNEDGTTEAVGDVTMKVSPDMANQVNFSFGTARIPEEDVLGYEIVRCMISQGQIERTPVGFVTGRAFSDTITTLNNRTVFYEITLVDHYLNRSATVATETVKIEHKGNLDKTGWEIATSGLKVEEIIEEGASDLLPCEPTIENPAKKAIDQDTDTVYTPSADGSRAEITLDFHRTVIATGFIYTSGNGSALADCEIQVCENGEWISVFSGALSDGQTAWFANAEEAYVSTHAVTALKLVINNPGSAELTFAELDVLGVTGDNVDFRRTGEDNTAVIGILSEDYLYGEGPEEKIPAGSLVFTGSYKGNPAYNVVLLYDQDGNLVGGAADAEGNKTASQVILADVPAGEISNVSNGTWVYWIAPEAMAGMVKPERVRAELYRVNNAQTNEGERLVSDSLFETVPENLPNITLGGGGN
ncbi:MAG: hypothetical protein HFI93_01240 [Lachnospiraceae bacterium]|nr:hypothetical protein [Lachnospiraceae bacterium]